MSAPPSFGHGVVVGLGANLGHPEAQLELAARALEARVGPLRASSLYASEAIGPKQAEFFNAAVLATWPGSLVDLLSITQDIERELGRERTVHWGPRSIDLDLLWAEGRCSARAELTVPHVELTHRAFALLPLLELQPDASVPNSGVLYRTFLSAVHSQRIRVVRGPEWWRAK